MRYLNPGFGGPWDMLGIFLVNVIIMTLQKFFWPKKILNSMHEFKRAILAMSQGPPNPGFRSVRVEN